MMNSGTTVGCNLISLISSRARSAVCLAKCFTRTCCKLAEIGWLSALRARPDQEKSFSRIGLGLALLYLAFRIVRHTGQWFLWSIARSKQSRQKLCPQGVVTGSNSRLAQSGHANSSGNSS